MSWFKKKEKQKKFEVRIYFNRYLDHHSATFCRALPTKSKAIAEFERMVKLWKRGGLISVDKKAFLASDIRYIEVREGD